MTDRTPTLVEVINSIIDAKIVDLHTSLPGKIVSYDHDKNLAVIQPMLMRKYKTMDKAVELPVITNVPVMFQRMNDGHLRFPIKANDTGLIVFMERSIDLWLIQGGMIDPEDSRTHSISDAVFFPGLNPNNKKIVSTAANDSVELKYNNSFIEIKSNGTVLIKNSNANIELDSTGKITLQNSGGAKYEILANAKFKMSNGADELFTELVTLVQNLIAAQTAMGSPFDAGTIANLNQRLTKLTNLKG